MTLTRKGRRRRALEPSSPGHGRDPRPVGVDGERRVLRPRPIPRHRRSGAYRRSQSRARRRRYDVGVIILLLYTLRTPTKVYYIVPRHYWTFLQRRWITESTTTGSPDTARDSLVPGTHTHTRIDHTAVGSLPHRVNNTVPRVCVRV